MSKRKIRAALALQLQTVVPSIPTVHENAGYTPVAGAPYQRTMLMPAESANPSYSDNLERATGIYQVLLCYPNIISNGGIQGTSPAETQADLVKAAFPRGSSFTFGGITVQIGLTPTIATAIIAGDRYCVPVRIRYFANIQP